MIPLTVIRKIILFFAPLVFLYVLRKIGKKKISKKTSQFDIDRNKIVEGEVIEKDK